MKILCDIGGTHARFAPASDPGVVVKYAAADFPSFEAALGAYCAQSGLHGPLPLRIATAAYPEGGVWRFVNRNTWTIDPAALERAGWTPEIIVNDFAAATRVLADPGSADRQVLHAGVDNETLARCLVGPGTGLGLAYLLPVAGGWHVQGTHGGHMLASALTQEHADIVSSVRGQKPDGSIVVFENLVSGPGLLNIYRVLAGGRAVFETPEALFENLGDKTVREAIRIFHEFFGLFAQTVVVSGNAYGGLYITGGVLDRLADARLFDAGHLRRFFVLKGVASVEKALAMTPVIRVTDPYLALKGLVAAHG